jgi:hypothetical protein
MGVIQVSINGRVNVDIVFHDIAGDNSIKIVELESTDSKTAGKVALVSGTHGPSTHTIHINNTGYYDASGSQVSLSSITRIGLKASRKMTLTDNQTDVSIMSDENRVSFSDCAATGNLTLAPGFTSGTASYTVFLYGT